MANPKGVDNGQEWFEIYNATDKSLDLTGVKLVATRGDGTSAQENIHIMDYAQVGSGEYFVLGNAPPGSIPNFVDYAYGEDITLYNDDGKIFVKCNDKTIDKVKYANAKTGIAQGFDGSEEPNADDNDDLGKWCAAEKEYDPDSFGTPGTANPVCINKGECLDKDVVRDIVLPQVSDLVITEIMADPEGVQDRVGEWFEVYVASDVDLNGLQAGRKEKGVEFEITSSVCESVKGDTYLVFAHTLDSAQNGGLPKVDYVFNFPLNNSETTLFVGLNNVKFNEITYPEPTKGVAWSLDQNQGSWCLAKDKYGDYNDLGTPGNHNPQCPPVPPTDLCLDE
jgi:hypothetical protein